MDETGTDFSQSNIAGPAIGQESGLSGEETVGLISRLLDSKLDKKFADLSVLSSRRSFRLTLKSRS